MNESDFLSSDTTALDAEVPIPSSTAQSPTGLLKSTAVSWDRNKSADKNVTKESGSWVQISPVPRTPYDEWENLGFGAEKISLKQKHPCILTCWNIPLLHLLPDEIPKSAPFHPQKCPGLVDKLYGHLILKSALPIVYMYHIFFIHSSVDGYLGCFRVLAIVNSAAMNIMVCVSLELWFSPGTDKTKKKLWTSKFGGAS